MAKQFLDPHDVPVIEGTEGWDGFYKGTLVSPGTYFYIITLDDIEGDIPLKYTGPLTVIRN